MGAEAGAAEASAAGTGAPSAAGASASAKGAATDGSGVATALGLSRSASTLRMARVRRVFMTQSLTSSSISDMHSRTVIARCRSSTTSPNSLPCRRRSVRRQPFCSLMMQRSLSLRRYSP